uniref:Proton myo-inositol cotransporter-like n=1 Tax=Hirondellea gigas TaxID=1518452 RepID=A0A6A7G6C7_9CRUS
METEEQTADTSPEGGLTRAMVVLTLFSAIGGFLFGYDTGVVSGAMLLVREDFELSTIWHECIVSATIAAAWLASLASGALADWYGRRRVIIAGSLLFTVGSVVMAASPGKGVLLLGRIIVGLAIGLASMCVPLYLSETAESGLRGRLTVTNVVFVTGGQFFASLVCAGLVTVDDGWRWMFGLAIVPAITQFVGFLFMPESPRWLVQQDRLEEAREVLQRFRVSDAVVDKELHDIVAANEDDKESSSGATLSRIFSTRSVRRALILGCLLQAFQQLAGINTVMYYSASIITMAGIGDPNTAIWISAGVASFNFVFTFVGLWLVERVGRRPLLLVSLAGVVLCLLELAVSFQLAYYDSPGIDMPTNMTSECSHYTSCSTCTFSQECGFCFPEDDSSYSNSSCLQADHDHFNQMSMSGDCTDPSALGNTFAYDWCPSAYSALAILGLCLYLLCFAPGMGTMPWTINSELYPGWARSRCVGIATSFNWCSNLIVSLTFLSLTQAINKHGTFYLFSAVSAVGLAVFYWWLPETRSVSMEHTHLLFQSKRPGTAKSLPYTQETLT